MELPPGAARRTNYSLLSQFFDDAMAAGSAPANILQPQSSGSNYGMGSSISASSEYPFHLPPPASAAAGPGSAAAAPGGSSPCKSWAQQAEETYPPRSRRELLYLPSMLVCTTISLDKIMHCSSFSDLLYL